MIRLEKISEKNVEQAAKLADSIFPDEKVTAGECFRDSLYDKDLKIHNVKNEPWDKAVSLQYYVAIDEDTNKVIGTTGVYVKEVDQDEACWLGWYCLDPGYRGKGIGRKILEETIVLARKLDKKYFRLYTSTDPISDSAQGLYEKLGFYEKEEMGRYPDGDSGYELYFREKKL